jgi:hypothetical protein
MEVEVGKVKHFYNHLYVAVLTLHSSLMLGDRIHICGHSTDFSQRIGSMEVNHHFVIWVRPGDDVAVKVIEPVHEHDLVYRVVEELLEPHVA